MTDAQTTCSHWRSDPMTTHRTGLTSGGECPYCIIDRLTRELADKQQEERGLVSSRDRWRIRHDRERDAHAANLKEWKKCEQELNSLKAFADNREKAAKRLESERDRWSNAAVDAQAQTRQLRAALKHAWKTKGGLRAEDNRLWDEIMEGRPAWPTHGGIVVDPGDQPMTTYAQWAAGFAYFWWLRQLAEKRPHNWWCPECRRLTWENHLVT